MIAPSKHTAFQPLGYFVMTEGHKQCAAEVQNRSMASGKHIYAYVESNQLYE